MPYVKIEPSGCCERHGLAQVRLAMYLEETDYAYERHHIYVPIILIVLYVFHDCLTLIS